MEGLEESRQVSSSDRKWWTSRDESYWHALLEQGEIAHEVVPPVDPQLAFQALDTESPLDLSRPQSVSGGDGHGDPEQKWRKAQISLDGYETFCLQILGANRGGLLVDWNGLSGFVPASQLEEAPRIQNAQERMAALARYIGESLTVRLIEVDPQQKRLVFSERVAASGMSPEAILNSLSPGDVRRGTVTNLTPFGAFVDLGGVEGLIHVSELSWDRVRHPGDVLNPGQEVDVYILGVNPEEGRIALSLKRLRSNPWTQVESRYQVGQVVEGQITNVVSFGAFVRIEEGLEGLVHISELAEGNLLHPRNVVREGDVVRVRVLNIDPGNQRLGLSLRQAHDAGHGAFT